MKYYIYISDAKVDMLLPQISEGHKKTIATEFGFDLKIFHAKRTTEHTANDERIARLEAVVSYIRKFENLGTIDEPREYIEDSAAMFSSLIEDGGEKMAYFSGTTGRTMIGLAGSSNHLIGASPATAPRGLHSLTASILMALEAAEGGAGQDVGTLGTIAIARLARHLRRRNTTERLSFMAKRLLVDYIEAPSLPEAHIILATPLYVAKED